MIKRNRHAIALGIIVALAVTPALSGCSLVKNTIQNATGGQVDVGGKSVPENFPKDAVPLIDGEVVYGGGVTTKDGSAWNVTIKVKDVSAFDSIKSQLEGAGFTSPDGLGGTTGDGATGAWDNDKFTVVVVLTKDGDKGFIANYSVATKAP